MSTEVIAILVTVAIAVVGWVFMFGSCKQKIDSNSKEIADVKAECAKEIAELKADMQKDIDEIKKDAKEQSVILQSINNNITDLNTQFRLFLSGQLKIKGVTE